MKSMNDMNNHESIAFHEFGKNFIYTIVQAEIALCHQPTYESVRHHFNNIEFLLMDYGCTTLNNMGPEGWQQTYDQILNNLNPQTLPFALKDRNPEAIALLKTVEKLDFYEPVLDGLLSAFKYDRSYFDKIVSSTKLCLEALIKECLGRYSNNAEKVVGKTRLAEILITQDIRRGDVTFVFDPKGDADLVMDLMMHCKMEQRVNRKSFSEQLNALMDKHGISSAHQFSEMTSVDSRVIRKWLNGEGNPGLDNLIAISDATGVSLDWLAGKE